MFECSQVGGSGEARATEAAVMESGSSAPQGEFIPRDELSRDGSSLQTGAGYYLMFAGLRSRGPGGARGRQKATLRITWPSHPSERDAKG